jgi:hypothetical protein
VNINAITTINDFSKSRFPFLCSEVRAWQRPAMDSPDYPVNNEGPPRSKRPIHDRKHHLLIIGLQLVI